jgi:hypothetical protein
MGMLSDRVPEYLKNRGYGQAVEEQVFFNKGRHGVVGLASASE